MLANAHRKAGEPDPADADKALSLLEQIRLWAIR
jgi:hypothetical protein